MRNAKVEKHVRNWVMEKMHVDLYNGSTMKEFTPPPYKLEYSKPVINDGKII